jgi:DNA/RNA endonuclease G (NUC1)
MKPSIIARVCARNRSSVAPLVLAMLALAGCSENGMLAPAANPATPDAPSTSLQCVADVRAHTLGCQGDLPVTGANRNVMLGGQGSLVRMTSTNVAYDSGTQELSADVTLQNLIGQTMGLSDGTTADSAGIRVFFSSGPNVTSGSGDASVANPDGVGVFTGANQSFFRYVAVLDSGQVSAPKHWRFHVDPTVGTFAFQVYVSAPLKPQLVINEIMADPAVTADADGEWLEVYNRGREDVILTGWKLASLNDVTQTVPAGVTVPAHGYVVFAKKTDPAVNGGVAAAWSFGGLNLANNATDWVALRSPANVTADSVIWGATPTSGASRAVIDAAADNTAANNANWKLGTAVYSGTNKGTPGAPNDGAATPPTSTGPVATVVVSPATVTLAPGATRQFSATARDANGQVTATTFTWTSLNTTVATISAGGLATAKADGTANVVVTSGNGFADTATITVSTVVNSTSAEYLNHVEFGTPTDGTPNDEVIVRHTEYVLSYSPKHAGPNWVSWDLNATHFGAAQRCDCFAADPLLPDSLYHVVTSDYTGSGYSRGHMVMSQQRTATDLDNQHAFFMTNILPQYQDMNGGPWEKFEVYNNDLARTSGKELYVIAGGYWPPNPATLNNAGKIEIPSRTWKIVVILPRGKTLADVHSTADLQVIAVDMPNVTGIISNGWEMYRTSVDAIEAATGYDFLALLPDSIENTVEASSN